MKDGGVLDVAGQPVLGNREVIELSNGTVLTASTSGGVRLTDTDGTPSVFGTGYGRPHGVIQLFDKRILATAGNGAFIFSRDGGTSTLLTSAAARRSSGAEAKPFIGREAGGQSIHGQCQGVCPLPDPKLLVRLHGGEAPARDMSRTMAAKVDRPGPEGHNRGWSRA